MYLHTYSHTHDHTVLLFSLPLYPSLSLSLRLSLLLFVHLFCWVVRSGKGPYITSPTSLGTTQWRRGKKEWGEIGLPYSLSLTLKPPHHHQQQMLAMTANCLPCTYLWYATDWKALSLLCLCAKHSHIHAHSCLHVCASWISVLAALGRDWDQHLVWWNFHFLLFEVFWRRISARSSRVASTERERDIKRKRVRDEQSSR